VDFQKPEILARSFETISRIFPKNGNLPFTRPGIFFYTRCIGETAMSNQNESGNTRREFLQKSLFLAASLPVLGTFLNACNSDSNDAPPSGEQAVKEEDAVAASLGYKADATKVDTEKFPKRKGPEGEKQFCKNCQFYTAKNDGWGTCQVVRNGDVKATGWCNTWAQKA
jgi:hypothetical protein